MSERTSTEIDRHLAALSAALTAPAPKKCVLCYVVAPTGRPGSGPAGEDGRMGP